MTSPTLKPLTPLYRTSICRTPQIQPYTSRSGGARRVPAPSRNSLYLSQVPVGRDNGSSTLRWCSPLSARCTRHRVWSSGSCTLAPALLHPSSPQIQHHHLSYMWAPSMPLSLSPCTPSVAGLSPALSTEALLIPRPPHPFHEAATPARPSKSP